MAGSEMYYQQLYLAGSGRLSRPGAKTFYVAASTYTGLNGSPPLDSNSGEDAQHPLLTAAAAHALCVAGRGDTIVLIGPVTRPTITKVGVRVVQIWPDVSWTYETGGLLSGSAEERVVSSPAAVLVNGTTLFTITGGPITAFELIAECVTANAASPATTLQYSIDPTGAGAATTFTGATATLASAAAGTLVHHVMTALTTAGVISADGVYLSRTAATGNPGGIILPAGVVSTVIGVGSSTGTWRHHLRYKPVAAGVTVS